MGDIDNTRNRLKLDNLKEDDRRNLFNKFVDAGGEVVTNRKKQTASDSSSSRKTTPNNYNKPKNNYPNNNTPRGNYVYTNTPQSTKKEKPNNTLIVKKQKSMFLGLKLWLDALSSKTITTFGGNVHNKFLGFIDKSVISAFLEMDTLIFNALNPIDDNSLEPKSKKEKILAQFSNDLEDIELLERIRDQYDENIYKTFLRQYKDLHSPTKASSYVNELKAMFKPLYILHAYSSKLKLAGEKALIAYSIVDNISKGVINPRISNFKKDVDLIYSKYYPKLFSLLQYACKEKLETLSDINNFLGITETDIVGYYTKLKKERDLKLKEETTKQQKEETKDTKTSEDNEEEKLMKIEYIGVKLIEKVVSFRKADNNIEIEGDPFFNVSDDDKIYRIKVLLDFLDREYSVLFVSNKVKYNLLYDNLVRTDYKSDFNNIFLSLSDSNSRFLEYSDMCKNALKVERDTSLRFEQRVSMLAEKNGQISYTAKNLKSHIVSIISSLKKKLDKLLLDKVERERIIANPNDILTFFSDVSGSKKRIQGYNVLKALTEAYYFVSGFYYLITSGELSGAGILIEGSKKAEEYNNKKDEDNNVNNDEKKDDLDDNLKRLEKEYTNDEVSESKEENSDDDASGNSQE
ncbi:hypothetical protein [Brachyspira pilosicoli]|uniref:hypothetical protein n=1 Tax=Brachyspira pilosicoli TaxID=52584 RepID=UPI001CA4F620|nr:hypothetical protein [Brachyspira pilosicoli]MBW5382308.1 hypothetical protein [Brachyspira pilosicoli]